MGEEAPEKWTRPRRLTRQDKGSWREGTEILDGVLHTSISTSGNTLFAEAACAHHCAASSDEALVAFVGTRESMSQHIVVKEFFHQAYS